MLHTEPFDCSLPSVLMASPRRDGNCALAARLIAASYTGFAGSMNEIHLRDYSISPCIGCDVCAKSAARTLAEAVAPYGCPLAAKDTSTPLVQTFVSSHSLCIVSPVYHYHVPAALKALIDRFQPFWHMAKSDAYRAALQQRTCGIVLIAGQRRGDRLFDGILISLRYALQLLGISLLEPLLLRGYDEKSDLAADELQCKAVEEYGVYMAELGS